MTKRVPFKSALSLAVLLASSGTVAAQEFRLGVIGGVSRADISLDSTLPLDFSPRTRVNAGVFATFRLSEGLFVEARAMFVQKGAQASVGARPTELARISVNYVAVPVLLRLAAPRGAIRPFLVAGPEWDFRTSAQTVNLRDGRILTTENIKDEVRATDLCLDLGAGLDIPAGRTLLLLEALYSHGLRNIAIPPDTIDVKLKNRTFQLNAGIRF